MELANQGGARVKMDAVEIVELEPEDELSGEDRLAYRCRWNATGSVGHWGHIHQRTNQYRGEFKVEELNGQWKFTEMEVLSEERL